MADSEEGKKHRLVHWDPGSDAPGSGPKPPQPPPPRGQGFLWRRILAVTGVVALLLLGWRVAVVWQEFSSEAASTPSREEPPPVAERPHATGDREGMRAARERATALRSTARIEGAGFSDAGALLEIERSFVQAERAAERRDFADAERRYFEIEQDLEDLIEVMRAESSARGRIRELEQAIARDSRVQVVLPDRLESVRRGLREANTALQAGRFMEADSRASEAARHFEDLRSAADRELDSRVMQGQRALAAGDADEARAIFARVLEIAPEEERAVIGLRRAETIAEVHELMAEAERLEGLGDQVGALRLYREAMELDPFAVNAAQAAARLERALRDTRVTQGLYEVDRLQSVNRWDQAETTLHQLVEAYPDDPRATQRLAQFERDRRENQIRQALAAARSAEQARDWERARQLYEDLVAMRVDRPQVVEGLERTGRIMRALQAFSFHMRAAHSAADRAAFQEAITRFNEAMDNKPDYLELSSEDRELERFLQAQSQPVPVRFITDGRTLVSYFGPMNRSPATMSREEVVELLPGSYRIRGTRMGYRSVEFELVVRGDGPMDPVRVVAHERAR